MFDDHRPQQFGEFAARQLVNVRERATDGDASTGIRAQHAHQCNRVAEFGDDWRGGGPSGAEFRGPP